VLSSQFDVQSYIFYSGREAIMALQCHCLYLFNVIPVQNHRSNRPVICYTKTNEVSE